MTYDVVVIGGGPAGMSGAVVLGRSLRTVLVIDGGEPRNAPAAGVHNFLTRDGITPGELHTAGRAEAERYGAEFRAGVVREVRAANGGFEVELADGGRAAARRVLVATGVRDMLPDIPGLAERWGTTVLHCPYCHGWEARGSAIGVIATGPKGVFQALLWSQWTDDLVLFTNDTAEPGAEEARQLTARGVRVLPGRVEAVTGEGVHLDRAAVIPRDHLVVQTRLDTRADFLAPLGLKPVEHPMGAGLQIPAEDPTGRTAVPGVWVAGNAADPMAQVVSSAAAGVAAGAAINLDLITAGLA